MIFGYKCFNKDLTNNYGFKFVVGQNYSVVGEIRAGVKGNGFHMCKNIEDTFRYYGAMNSEISVCEVVGSGMIVPFCDEYYGYYDMYSVETIKIVRLLSREEIIEMALNFDEERVMRFVQLYKLTSSEVILFKHKFVNNLCVMNYIAYYQEGNKDVFNFNRRKLKKEK